MKRTIERTDGSKETIEGTPEEISEYQNKLQEQPGKKKLPAGKKLLLEEDVRRIANEEIVKKEFLRLARENYPLKKIEDEYSPWKLPFGPNIRWGKDTYTQPCLVQEFFRNNPNGTCMIACPCPLCTIQCTFSTVSKVDTGSVNNSIPFISAFTIVN